MTWFIILILIFFAETDLLRRVRTGTKKLLSVAFDEDEA
jgi:hypothetical protein